jgi:hypothetical protein
LGGPVGWREKQSVDSTQAFAVEAGKRPLARTT